MFIVFDGIDGAGKSTQLELCRNWLDQNGHDVVTCADPGSTLLGLRIRDILLQRTDIPIDVTAEMFLFMVARSQLTREIIEPALKAARVVLCDRFLLSTVVYQGHARQLDVRSIWNIGRVATGGIEPDLTIVFDLPVDEAQRRFSGAPDRVESRGSEYLGRVRQGFLTEAGAQPKRIVLIDAAREIQEIQQDVRRLVAERLERRIGKSDCR